MALIQHTQGQAAFSGKTATRTLTSTPTPGHYLMAVCGATPVKTGATYAVMMGDHPFIELASRVMPKDYGPGLSLFYRKVDGTESGLSISGTVTVNANHVDTALWVGEFDQLPGSLVARTVTETSTNDLDRVLTRPTGSIADIKQAQSLVLAAWMTQQRMVSPSSGDLEIVSDSHVNGWVHLLVGYRYTDPAETIQETTSWPSPKTTATSVMAVFDPAGPITNTPPKVTVVEKEGKGRSIVFTVTVDIP